MSTLNVNEARFTGCDDAAVLQAALDAARPGDTVVVPRYNARRRSTLWQIAKALELPSGVRVLLDNCTLVQATGCYDNLFTNKPGAKGFSLIGLGNVELSGGEGNYLSQETQGLYGLPDVTVNAMFSFDGASDFTLDNLIFTFPRWATIRMQNCSGAAVQRIFFDMVPHVPHLKGIQLECGCHDITIDTVMGRCGEDVVALEADEAVPVMPETDIWNITIRNFCCDQDKMTMIRINPTGGHSIYHVTMDTICDASHHYQKSRPASLITFGLIGATPRRPAALGEIRDIRADHMFTRAHRGICLSAPVQDAEFKNLLTYGDIVFVLNNTRPTTLENVRFERLYYGKGSKPNVLDQFVGRVAKGSVAVRLNGVDGNYTIDRLLQEDEDMEEN